MKRDDDTVPRLPSKPSDEGSAARRIAWAVVGMLVYFVVKYALGQVGPAALGLARGRPYVGFLTKIEPAKAGPSEWVVPSSS